MLLEENTIFWSYFLLISWPDENQKNHARLWDLREIVWRTAQWLTFKFDSWNPLLFKFGKILVFKIKNGKNLNVFKEKCKETKIKNWNKT